MNDAIKPYNQDDSKKEQVRKMFDAISPKYDLLNHVLSLNIDRSWRRKMGKMVVRQNPDTVLDMATGTGDFAILMSKMMKNARITGADLSPEMLEIGRKKITKRGINIDMQVADAEDLPFLNDSFDAVTAVFGVRNFENLQRGLEEMCRVMKKGGKLYILEFSIPRRSFFAWIYKFYFKNILPIIGRMVSRDVRAYTYLTESVNAFPCYNDFLKILHNAGFKDAKFRALTFGVATIYTAEK